MSVCVGTVLHPQDLLALRLLNPPEKERDDSRKGMINYVHHIFLCGTKTHIPKIS